MEKREVARLLKQGLAYTHIAESLGVTHIQVANFVNENLPELARTAGRVPHVVADDKFMSKFQKQGAEALAKEYKVSISAIYRAKYRYEQSCGKVSKSR